MSTGVLNTTELASLLEKLDGLLQKSTHSKQINDIHSKNIPLLTEIIDPELELQQLLQKTKTELKSHLIHSVQNQLDTMINRQLNKHFEIISKEISEKLKPQIEQILPILIQRELDKIKYIVK